VTLDALSDRLNPMVVKEVRQGLRARTFVVGFHVLLAGCVVMSFTTADRSSGPELFTLFFGAYGLAGFVVVPLAAFRSLLADLTEESWSAITLSGLSARQVLGGKVASSLVQGALYASAAAPFVLFSYFLGGISLASVLLAMSLAAAWQVILTVVAVAAATLATSPFARRGAAGVMVGLLLGAFSLAMQTQHDLARSPEIFLSTGQLLGAAGVALFVGSFAWLTFEMAVGRLSPASANTAVGPRVALLVHLAIPVAATLARLPPYPEELAFSTFVYGTLLLFALGVMGLGQPAAAPRAVREKRPLFGLLVPGAWRAFRFAVLTEVVLTLLLSVVVDPTVHPAGLDGFLTLPLMLGAALALPVLASALVPALRHPLVLPAFACVVVLLAITVPLVLSQLADLGPFDPTLNALNPAAIVYAGLGPEGGLPSFHRPLDPVPMAVAAGLVVLADRILAARERAALHG
jgi:hypothetical protein